MKNPNFSSIQGKYVKIRHYSIASVIKVIIAANDLEEDEQTVWLDYDQFDSLIDTINSLEND